MARPRKSYTLWIAGALLRVLVGCVILAIVLLLLWRVFLSGRLPKSMKSIAPNESLAAAYAEKGEALVLFDQVQGTVTRNEESYGYFGVPRFVFIPDAKQLQLVFRYNNSTLKAVARDLELAEALPRGEELFDVSLVLRRDLTPDDLTDNTDGSATISRERYHPTLTAVDTTALYTYFLYTFEGVELTDDTIVGYIDIYYGLTPDYGESPMADLRLYHRDDPKRELQLTGKEEKALAAFGK